jgi:hypothetical protein
MSRPHSTALQPRLCVNINACSERAKQARDCISVAGVMNAVIAGGSLKKDGSTTSKQPKPKNNEINGYIMEHFADFKARC